MQPRAGSVVLLTLLVAHPLAAQRTPDNVCRVAQPLTPVPGLREASGLATSRRGPARLFAVNDSAEPEVVVLNPDGSRRGRVRLEGASVTDWEDVTSGPCPGGTCLFVSDVGDNDAVRQGISLYRMVEPPDGTLSTRVERLDLTYPDGPHDAEALFTGPEGRLYLLTKEPRRARLYRLPSSPPGGTTSLRLELVAVLEAGSGRTRFARITDAETSPDGTTVAIRTNEALFLVATDVLTDGRLTGMRSFPLRVLREPQGEGVAIGQSGDVFLAGESGGGRRRDGTFARLSCPSR